MSYIGQQGATAAQRTLLGLQGLTDGYLSIEGGNITNVGDMDVVNLTVTDTATIQNMVVISTIASNISANNYYGGLVSTISANIHTISNTYLNTYAISMYQTTGFLLSTTNVSTTNFFNNTAQITNGSITNLSSTTASIQNLYTMSMNVSNINCSTLRCSVASVSQMNCSEIRTISLTTNTLVGNYISCLSANIRDLSVSTLCANYIYSSFLSCSIAYFDRIDSCNVLNTTTANISDLIVSFTIANDMFVSTMSVSTAYVEQATIIGLNTLNTITNVQNTNYTNTGYMNTGTVVADYVTARTLRSDGNLMIPMYTPLSEGDSTKEYHSITFDNDYLYVRLESAIWKKVALLSF